MLSDRTPGALSIENYTPEVSRFRSLFHVFIDKRGRGERVTAFQTLFKDTNGNKGHPQVTGMVPKAWL